MREDRGHGEEVNRRRREGKDRGRKGRVDLVGVRRRAGESGSLKRGRLRRLRTRGKCKTFKNFRSGCCQHTRDKTTTRQTVNNQMKRQTGL